MRHNISLKDYEAIVDLFYKWSLLLASKAA